jgi:hypothetical protein
MEIKDIAQKVLNGEDVSTITKDFDDAKQIELNKTIKTIAKEDADKELARAIALRAERSRVETQTTEAQDKIASEIRGKITSEMRTEQITKAENRLTKDFNLTPEDAVKVKEAFKNVDTGKQDAEFIYNDLQRAYAIAFSDRLIQAEKDKKTLEANAFQFNAGSTGAGSSGGAGTDNSKTYSPQAYAVVKEAQAKGMPLTLEEAEKGLSGGNSWRILKA